jgi:serine/threonine protein kinase
MTLAAGSRLGPYEIVSPLGAGGMGEVYRARDTRLERTVAIKVLPSRFASDADSNRAGRGSLRRLPDRRSPGRGAKRTFSS